MEKFAFMINITGMTVLLSSPNLVSASEGHSACNCSDIFSCECGDLDDGSCGAFGTETEKWCEILDEDMCCTPEKGDCCKINSKRQKRKKEFPVL